MYKNTNCFHLAIHCGDLEKAKRGKPLRFEGNVYSGKNAASAATGLSPYKIGKQCEFITLDEFIATSK